MATRVVVLSGDFSRDLVRVALAVDAAPEQIVVEAPGQGQGQGQGHELSASHCALLGVASHACGRPVGMLMTPHAGTLTGDRDGSSDEPWLPDPSRMRAFLATLRELDPISALPEMPEAVFVALPQDGSASCGAFLRDSLRHAVAHARACRGERGVRVVCFAESMEQLLEQAPEVLSVEDFFVRFVLVPGSCLVDDLARVLLIARCEMGCIIPRGACAPCVAWAGALMNAAPHKRVYVQGAGPESGGDGEVQGLGAWWAEGRRGNGGDGGDGGDGGNGGDGGEEWQRWLRVWTHAGDTFVGAEAAAAGSGCIGMSALHCERLRFEPDELHVMWINMDRSVDRRTHMERMLAEWGVPASAHTRVAGVDGGDLAALAACVVPHPGTSPRTGACSASHVLALARFLAEHPTCEVALVLEDDVTFELVGRWRRTLVEYLRDAGPAWEVIQLGGIICDRADAEDPGLISTTRAMPRAKDNWFSTVAYAIRRGAAQRLVARHLRVSPDPSPSGPESRERTWAVDLSTCEGRCADPEPLIYGPASSDGRTLFLPLFNFLGTDSYIDARNSCNHGVAKGYVRALWARSD